VDSSGAQPQRRGYGQYCAVASALDVVGERWTLLVVRDLFLGPKRYTDLRAGLPGIATDLLTARLRTLEGAGLVQRRTLPKPAPATVYDLTDRGRLLGPALAGLADVGFRLLGDPDDETEMPADRLVLALRAAFKPDAVLDHHATYELELDEEPFVIAVSGEAIDISRGTAAHADLVVRARPTTLARLLRRTITAAQARANESLHLEGDADLLDDFVATFAFPTAADAAG
jgi:DNA-binding HxlR family transcriptional regulator